MKKLWCAAAILAALLAVTLWNSHCVAVVSEQLSNQLVRAGELAEAGDWDGAEAMTRAARKQWEGCSDYLYTVLTHSSTDAVEERFHETLAFLQWKDAGEYSAANAALIAHVRLLSDTERLTLHNLL